MDGTAVARCRKVTEGFVFENWDLKNWMKDTFCPASEMKKET